MAITDNGYTVRSITEISDELKASIITDYPDLLIQPETFEGHIVDLVSSKIHDLELKMASLYNNTPKTAIGQALYSYGALKGLEPFPAQPSISTQTFVGTLNTIVPINTLVVDNSGYNYRTITQVTLTTACTDNKIFIGFNKIPTIGTWTLTIDSNSYTYDYDETTLTAHPDISSASGDYTDGFEITLSVNPTTISVTYSSAFDAVPFTQIVEKDDLYKASVLALNTVSGAYESSAYRISSMVTAVSGVDYTYNLTDTTEGQDAETDEEFFIRFTATSLATGNTLDGIKNRLMATINEDETTDLIRKVKIKEHYSAGATGAPNSLEVFVAGGDTRGQEIADELRLNLISAGITMLGDEVYTSTDDDGNDHVSNFSYIDKIDIDVRITMTTESNYSGDDAVKEAIVAWGNALDVGEDVVVLPDMINSLCEIDGIGVISVIQVSDDGGSNWYSTISIGDYEESSWSTADITIS